MLHPRAASPPVHLGSVHLDLGLGILASRIFIYHLPSLASHLPRCHLEDRLRKWGFPSSLVGATPQVYLGTLLEGRCALRRLYPVASQLHVSVSREGFSVFASVACQVA